jgi:hypothetical protein
MSPVFMSKNRAVRAFLIEMSMLPSQAPSIRPNALRFPPASRARRRTQGGSGQVARSDCRLHGISRPQRH